MADFQTLTDAFVEFERRADALAPSHADDPTINSQSQRRLRPMLLAATIIGVLAIAIGSLALAQRNNRSSDAAGTSPQPHTVAAGPRTFASESAANTFVIPRTPEELARRFRIVLGDTATFTVTDTGSAVTMSAPPAPTRSGLAPSAPVATSTPTPEANGAAIVGTLTAADRTGGYDLQIFQASSTQPASCDDPDRSNCTVRRLPDGSSLAVGREPLNGSANGVTYQVALIRPDGVEFLMHVSNERDPKGESRVLAASPPLTTDEMTTLLTSDRW